MVDGGSDDRAVTQVVTRSGDGGHTQLGSDRVLKCVPRIAAYGAVDEANSVIGLLRAAVRDRQDVDGWLKAIQMDMFDIGTDLDMPGDVGAQLRFKPEPVLRVERQLEELNARQPLLRNFVLPTGIAEGGARAHHARTVVRRAEREVVALMQVPGEEVNPEIPAYLNRLSDFLFVLARHLNDDGAGDEIWRPHGQR